MDFNHCFLLLTLLPFCSAKDTVPAFLIDYDQVMNHLIFQENPFIRTSSAKFADIVEDAVRQSSVIIIFVGDSLSTEDISLKDSEGTPFQNLREHLLNYRVKYFPNVVNPVKLLTRLLEPTNLNVYVVQSDQEFKPTESMRFFYVFLKDDSKMSRANALRRHDKVMQEVYETTRKIANGAVVAFYTGKVNPVVFSTFDYGPTDVLIGKDPTDVTMASFGAMVRFKGMTIDEGPNPTRRSLEMDLQDSPRIVRNQRTGNTTTTQVAAGKYYMNFIFSFWVDHWTLETIVMWMEEDYVGEKHPFVKVPNKMSYFCDEPMIFYNKKEKVSIIIPEYQLQPFGKRELPAIESYVEIGIDTTRKWPVNMPTTTPPPIDYSDYDYDYVEFGPPVKCTNYFNISILTGLLIFGLMVIVIGIAVHCLYHIETNDRYEDPHGKLFFTNTTE